MVVRRSPFKRGKGKEDDIYALLSPLIVLHVLPNIMHRDREH